MADNCKRILFSSAAHDQIFMMDKLASNQVHLEKATSMAIDDLSENHLKLIGQQQEMAKIADKHRYDVPSIFSN